MKLHAVSFARSLRFVSNTEKADYDIPITVVLLKEDVSQSR